MRQSGRQMAPIDLALQATSIIVSSLMSADHENAPDHNLSRGLEAVNAISDYLFAIRKLEVLSERPEA